MKLSTLSSAIAALLLASSAHAGFYTYVGDTTGGPTFNRPDIDYLDYPFPEVPSGLSADADAVAYHAFSFTVSVTGTYTILTLSSSVDFDTFVILYDGAFNPASPMTHAAVANDDAVYYNTSGVTFDMVAGNTYTYVVTGYDNDQFGAFSTTIGGPGSIAAAAAVPEPATWGLMGLGVAGLAAFARRRREQQA